jgi:hypothetical protein
MEWEYNFKTEYKQDMCTSRTSSLFLGVDVIFQNYSLMENNTVSYYAMTGWCKAFIIDKWEHLKMRPNVHEPGIAP